MSVEDCRTIVLRQWVMWEDSAHCGWHYYLGRGSWTMWEWRNPAEHKQAWVHLFPSALDYARDEFLGLLPLWRHSYVGLKPGITSQMTPFFPKLHSARVYPNNHINETKTPDGLMTDFPQTVSQSHSWCTPDGLPLLTVSQSHSCASVFTMQLNWCQTLMGPQTQQTLQEP